MQLRLSAGGRDSVERVLLSEPEVRRPLPAGCDSVVVNEGGHGFYRVRYDADLLGRAARPASGAGRRSSATTWSTTRGR